MDMILDRITLGARSKNFDFISEVYRNDAAFELVFEMTADTGTGSPLLAPGSGEIARIFFVLDSSAGIGQTASVEAPEISGYGLSLANVRVSYAPVIVPGSVTIQSGIRGDADNSGEINIVDVSYIINYLYKDGPAPITVKAGDADSNEAINLLDATYLIDYLYKDGPSPEE
jgi:hypothetical protein